MAVLCVQLNICHIVHIVKTFSLDIKNVPNTLFTLIKQEAISPKLYIVYLKNKKSHLRSKYIFYENTP